MRKHILDIDSPHLQRTRISLPRSSAFLRVLFFAFFLVSLFPSSPPARAEVQTLPDTAYVNGVVGHPQQRNLTCESRSASDFAAFFGVNASEADIFAALPASDNPNYGFVGSPDGTWGQTPPHSYGVHANPIEDALNGFGLPVYGERHLSWDFLRSEIAAGRPVIVWIIGSMWDGTPIEYVDEKGRTAIVARYEHSMMLIGYDPSNVWVIDAYDGQEKIFPVASFLTSWAVLENMAVYYRVNYTEHVYLPMAWSFGAQESLLNEPATPYPQPEANPAAYTVQPGDSLRGVADQFGTTWENLAEINGLSSPYVIYPGQELQLTP